MVRYKVSLDRNYEMWISMNHNYDEKYLWGLLWIGILNRKNWQY